MSEKNKLKSELILEVAQLQQRIKELESAADTQPGKGPGSNWGELADSSADHITALGPDLTIQYVNHASPGLTKDDLIGKSIASFVDEEKSEEVIAILHSVILTGEPAIYETEFQIPGEDGGKIYYETHALPRKIKDEVIGLTLNSRDITIRKKIEKEFNSERDKIRSIFRSAPIGIGMVSNRILLHANDFLCKMIGYEPEELINQDARILYPSQEEYDYVGDEKYRQINSLGVGTVETRFKRRNGEIIDVLLSSSPIDPENLISGVTFSALDITARVQTEQALFDSEKKYRELVNLAQEGIWVIDKESITTFVNPSMEKILGYSSGEMIGKHLFSFMDERGVEIAQSNLERRQNGIAEQHDFEFLRKDKKRIYVTLETAAVTDKNGNYDGAIAGVIDITQRVETEKAFKESQRQLSTLMENLPGMAYRCDNDDDFTMRYVSAGCYDLTGYRPGDLIENALLPYADIIHPDDIDYVRRTVQEALLVNKSFRLIYRIKTAQDDEKWVWEQGEGIHNELDEIVALEGFITDISELKNAEIKLAHSHNLMNYIIEHNRSAIAVHDKNLNYIYVSNRYLEEYKVEDPDIIGKHHYEVFPDLPQKWRDVHQKALAGEILSADEDPYLREDGNQDWTRWECRPWYEADGTIGGIIVYTEVITDRIIEEQEKDRLLRELKEANDRLTSLSRELINSQEAERQRISQELHDEFGQALTAISLDLGIIERELTPGCPADLKKRVSDTRGMADELDQMIGELALDLRPSLLDDLGLLPTLNWYVERFSKRAEIKVKIETVVSDIRLPSEIETALYRIVQEALTNVAKHSGAKEVILRLTQQPKMMKMSIEDDGEGFDLAEMQSAHVPFRGLGLIGMADRAALLGGHLDIQSSPGEGTRIDVKIPLE